MRSSLSYLNGFGDLESIFGMVTVRGQLNNGCQQRVQIAAKGYEQPDLYEFFTEW
ncbi:MAG: hypothetical protein IJ610_11600 [Bacteroidaceae bacterium]|nr:hypothetical protein [Bacteroidaceae bacterium]